MSWPVVGAHLRQKPSYARLRVQAPLDPGPFHPGAGPQQLGVGDGLVEARPPVLELLLRQLLLRPPLSHRLQLKNQSGTSPNLLSKRRPKKRMQSPLRAIILLVPLTPSTQSHSVTAYPWRS